jgi:hypothetical protein
MKTWMAVSALCAALPVAAGELWMTRHEGEIEYVTALASAGPETVDTQRAATLAFGESPARLLVASWNPDAAENQLRVIDKQTRQLIAIWPVPERPVSLLSGAAPDIVVLDEVAYLLSHSSDLVPGAVFVRNARGGTFNVVRIALRTGATHVLPLGDAFANPRLTNYLGIPVVTDWAGFAVWRLADDGAQMIAVVGQQELCDILPLERSDQARRILPYSARPDFVVVPGSGVFRLSSFGELHRITDARLAPLRPPHASLRLGPAQFQERLLAGFSRRGPAIVSVRNENQRRTLTFIDAATLEILWQRELPGGTRPWTVTATGVDAVVYIDAQERAIKLTDREETRVFRDLPFGGEPGQILSIAIP